MFATLGCAVTTPPKTVTQPLVDDVGKATLTDGSTGLCRLTGSVGVCPVTVPAPPGLAKTDPVDSLQLTITTGNDDLRGGSFAGDNANVQVGNETFRDVNDMYDWPNGSVNSFPLVITSAMTLGEITSVDVITGFGGGVGGDNWDIAAVELQATVTVPGHGSALAPPHRFRSPHPPRPLARDPAPKGRVAPYPAGRQGRADAKQAAPGARAAISLEGREERRQRQGGQRPQRGCLRDAGVLRGCRLLHGSWWGAARPDRGAHRGFLDHRGEPGDRGPVQRVEQCFVH